MKINYEKIDDIRLEYAKLSDLDSLVKIEKMIFSDYWNEKMLEDTIISDYDYFLLLKLEDNIVGYINWRVNFDEAELMKIGVLPFYQTKGYANILMNYMINNIKEKGILKVFLEVRKTNEVAKTLYKKYGFEFIGTRKDYYVNPICDALVGIMNIR